MKTTIQFFGQVKVAWSCFVAKAGDCRNKQEKKSEKKLEGDGKCYNFAIRNKETQKRRYKDINNK